MSNTTARKTVAGAYAEIARLDSKLDLILAALDVDAKAKPAPKAPKARKTVTRKPAKKAAAPKVTQGAKAYAGGSGMTRATWNKTLSTKARFAGGDTYRRVMADWAEASALRTQGATPDEVLALYTA